MKKELTLDQEHAKRERAKQKEERAKDRAKAEWERKFKDTVYMSVKKDLEHAQKLLDAITSENRALHSENCALQNLVRQTMYLLKEGTKEIHVWTEKLADLPDMRPVPLTKEVERRMMERLRSEL